MLLFLLIRKFQNAVQQITIKTRWHQIHGFKKPSSNKTRLRQPKTKSIRGCLSSPSERSEAERKGASSTLTGSSTLNNDFRSNQKYSEFRPLAERQEEKK